MNDDVAPIRRALFSVFDKRELIELARVLAQTGAELLASGGTRTALADSGSRVSRRSPTTPASLRFLGGRVKTLHPKIHAGILARRDVPDDLATLERQGVSAD